MVLAVKDIAFYRENVADAMFYFSMYFLSYIFLDMNVSDALTKIELGFPQSEERDTILEFIRASKRGIIRGADSTVKGNID